MDLQVEIEKMANSLLTESAHFIVDTVISGNKNLKKIMIVVDGDQGITIEDCARLSRGLSSLLDEKELVGENYTLEVTTPGVDTPLKLKRQYQKNVGRNLKVTLKDKSQVKGKLVAATDSQIEIAPEEKQNKKKQEVKKIEIPFDLIDKALVQISFK